MHTNYPTRHETEPGPGTERYVRSEPPGRSS